METNDKNPGDKKWNNEQQVNEGFSGENLPAGYNDDKTLMHPELETDQFGNETEVKRARFPHQNDKKFIFDAPATSADTTNAAIENKKSLENRDRNYDISTDRYPYSNPESHKDRGNFDVNES